MLPPSRQCAEPVSANCNDSAWQRAEPVSGNGICSAFLFCLRELFYGLLYPLFPARQRTDLYEKWPPASRLPGEVPPNLYEKWPLEPISQQVAQGGPASIEIHTKSSLRRPFPSKWPREVPPTYKPVEKALSGGHFPAGGPGKSCDCKNRYEKRCPEPIS